MAREAASPGKLHQPGDRSRCRGPDRADPPRGVSYRQYNRCDSGPVGPKPPLSIADLPVPGQQLMLLQGGESFPAIPRHLPGDGLRQQRSELCVFPFFREKFGLGVADGLCGAVPSILA